MRLIEPRGQRLAEARDQRPARQRIEALDPLQPQALQHLDGIGIQPQRGHRQRRQRHPGAARRHDLHRIIAVAGERPGGAGRIGDRCGHGQALAAQPGKQVRAQRRLAAEQMGAAGHVQPEGTAAGARMAAIDGDVGRIALAPRGEILEQPGIGGGIGGPHLERRHHRAGIGQHHAGRESGFCGARAYRLEPKRALLVQKGDERSQRIQCGSGDISSVAAPGGAEQPIGREVRQPQREDPRSHASPPAARRPASCRYGRRGSATG